MPHEKKLQAELDIREKAINEAMDTLKSSVTQRQVVPLFRQEVNTALSNTDGAFLFVNRCLCSRFEAML